MITLIIAGCLFLVLAFILLPRSAGYRVRASFGDKPQTPEDDSAVYEARSARAFAGGIVSFLAGLACFGGAVLMLFEGSL